MATRFDFLQRITLLLMLCALLCGIAGLASATTMVNVGGNASGNDITYWSGSSLWANVLNNFCRFSTGPTTADGFPMASMTNSWEGFYLYVPGLWPTGAGWTLRYQGDTAGNATVGFGTYPGNGAIFTATGAKTYSNGVWTVPMQFTDNGWAAGITQMNFTVIYAAAGLSNGVATDPIHDVQLTYNNWYPNGTVPTPLPLFTPTYLARVKTCSTLRFMTQMNGCDWTFPTLCINGNGTNSTDFDGHFAYGTYDAANSPSSNSFGFADPYGTGSGVPIYLPHTGSNDGGHAGYQQQGAGIQCLAGTAAAPATINYVMNGVDGNFSAVIGKDVLGAADNGTLVFEVWADGVKLYPIAGIDPTTPMKAGDQYRSIFISVAGYNELTLKVYDPNGPTVADWADWGTPEMWNLATWSTRPSSKVFYSTQTNGMAIEKLVQFCNATNCDGWFCIPVSANNDFVTNFTNLLLYGEDANGNVYTSTQANPYWPPLNANLKAYIEYGNEVWNTSLGPNWSYVTAWSNSPTGVGGGEPAQYAERVKQIGEVMKPLFAAAGQSSRLKIVLAGQMGGGPQGAGLSYLATKYGAPKNYVDAVAVAPYFGQNGSVFSSTSTVEDVLNGFEDGSGAGMDGGALDNATIPEIQQAAAQATSYGLPLLSYEGGESTYCYATDSVNAIIGCWNAQHATRMGAMYDLLLQSWAKYAGNGVFDQFVLIDNGGTTFQGNDPSKYRQFFGAIDQGNEVGSMKYDSLCRNSRPAGDADCDGTTSYADFLTLQQNFGRGQSGSPSASWWLSTDNPAYWSQGDFNNDQIVDMADFWLLYGNLSSTDQLKSDVIQFIEAHQNPVILPQLWATPIALAVTGNTGGISTYAGIAASLDVPGDQTYIDAGEPPLSDGFTFNLVQAPRHGSVTFAYPNVTYTPTAGYIGSDDFWVSVTDVKTGLQSNKIWIPVNVSPIPPLLTWNFAGSSLGQTSFSPTSTFHSTALNLVFGNGVTAPAWMLGAGSVSLYPAAPYAPNWATNLSDAIAKNMYVTFQVSPKSGEQLSLTTLTYFPAFQNASPPDARGSGITFSTDGVNFSSGIVPSGTDSYAPTKFTVDLSGQSSLQKTTNTVTFRLYLYGNGPYETAFIGGTGGNDIFLSGSYQLLPPPAPTITSIANQIVNPNTSTGALAFTIGDALTPMNALTVTGVSSNPTLFPAIRVVIGGTGASRTVSVTPAANQTGTATITLTVTNNAGLKTTTSFTVTVNTPPTITTITSQLINMGTSTAALAFTVGDDLTLSSLLTLTGASSNTALIKTANIAFTGPDAQGHCTVTVTPVAVYSGVSTITLTVTDGGGLAAKTSFILTVNHPPTITVVANQFINMNSSTTAVAFTVGDDLTLAGALTVTAASSNPSLAPNANVVLAGSGAARTVKVTPVIGISGISTISLTVTDGGGLSTTTSYLLEVYGPPSISAIANQTINLNASTAALVFTVGDSVTAASALIMSGLSSNPTLFPTIRITFSGNGAARTVKVRPGSNQSGTATITLTVKDGGGLKATTSFTVTVNTAPTITTVANQLINMGTSTPALAFTVGDDLTAPGALLVSCSASNTALVKSANMVLTGPDVQGRCTVTVTPVAIYSGVSTMTLTVKDGGGMTSKTSFVLTVNRRPTITAIAAQAINMGAATGALAFTVGDDLTSAGALTLSGVSSNTLLVPNANIVFNGSGSVRNVTVTPVAGNNGAATITVTVTDGGGLTASTSFLLTVNGPPSITALANQTINLNASTAALAFTIGDDHTAASALKVFGVADNTTLFPTSRIILGGSGAVRTVSVRPGANQSGMATITLTVTDSGGLKTNTSFTVMVNAPPTITSVANQTISKGTSTAALTFSVGDDLTSPAALTVTAIASNTALVKPAGIVVTPPNALGVCTVTITPVAVYSGISTITLTVKDSGGLTTKTSFTVTVN